MTTRLLLKLAAVLAVLLFMVIMGMYNNPEIDFTLPGKTFKDVATPIIYFAFLGAGMLLGAVVAIGWRSSGK